MEEKALLLGKSTWFINMAHSYTSDLLVTIIKAFSFPLKNKEGH